MALDYSFLMATEQDVRLVTEEIAERFSLERVRGNLRGPGVLLSGSTVHPNTREHYEADAGIVPVVSILFTVDKGALWGAGCRLMTRICAQWLAHKTGDAALVQHGERLLLLRRAGVLTVNSETDWWTPQLLALLPPGRQRGPLPVL